MKKVRTRYAPSPTGPLHIGGARTALFSYLYAKHYQGDFVVRIEDTDQSRNIKNGEKLQLENLIWLGIIPDESPQKKNPQYGPYRQSQKINRYNELIEELLVKNIAYRAYETPNELKKQKGEQAKKGIASFRYDKNWLKLSEEEIKKRNFNKEYTIRLHLKPNKIYKWNDIVRGKIEVNTNDIGDFIIRKQDGYPTYNFAVTVDDHDMAITNVLRGEEHIINTPKQLAIYDLFNWNSPQFGHLTIITNIDGKKLSKRDDNLKQFIEDYKKSGYSSMAIFNYLTLLGWTHPNAKEKMTKQEIIESFDPTRLSKSPTKFDIKKMKWFSKEYIKVTPNKVLKLQMTFENKSNEWIELFIETYKQATTNIDDLKNFLAIYNNKEIKQIKRNEVVDVFAKKLDENEFSCEGINNAIMQTKEITKIDGKNLFMPIRKATTYLEHGPELAKTIYLFGEEIIKARLK